MKWIFILLILFSATAYGQWQRMAQPGYGPIKRLWIDSVLIIPTNVTYGDNLAGGRDVGQIRYNLTDSVAQIWTGYQWTGARSDYQAPLVSATNIKTINGSSILGSGDLVVSGADATKLAILNNLSDLNNAGTARTNLSLGNVTNTSDANKPVSTAQQTALDLKANIASPTFTGTVGGITATMVGLGNVTNEAKDVMFTNAVFTGTFATAAGAIANSALANSAVANLSGTNTGDQTTVSGNAGTATTLQTARLIDGKSFNGSADIVTNNDILAYEAFGSAILAETVGQKLFYSNVSTPLVDGQIKYTAIYLPKAATLTGIKVYVRVLGNYTGDNNNRIGLYSYSGGTLTLVASSANDANLWKSAANAVQTIPFSSTYAASAGIFVVGMLYNQSAVTTAPSLASAVALNNLVMGSTVWGFTNSAKLYGTSTGTDLAASIAMSSITSSVIPSWVALY